MCQQPLPQDVFDCVRRAKRELSLCFMYSTVKELIIFILRYGMDSLWDMCVSIWVRYHYSSCTTRSRPEQRREPPTATANRQQVKSDHPVNPQQQQIGNRWSPKSYFEALKKRVIFLKLVLYFIWNAVKFSNKVTGKEFRIFRGHHNQRNLNLNVELDAGMQSSTDE